MRSLTVKCQSQHLQLQLQIEFKVQCIFFGLFVLNKVVSNTCLHTQAWEMTGHLQNITPTNSILAF
jgi:hypothetical protein